MATVPGAARAVPLLLNGYPGGQSPTVEPTAEWLEADGLGGYASGTVCGVRTRRYHALLLSAEHPPTGRRVLVNGVDALVRTPRGQFAVSSQHYAPDVVSPDGLKRLEAFGFRPWPTWHFQLDDGVRVRQEIFTVRGAAATVARWSLREPAAGVRLEIRPFLSGRDYHATHHENPAFRFEPHIDHGRIRFLPYAGVPEILLLSNGEYCHDPHWYRRFLYAEERDRGLDCVEDLAAPGRLSFDLSAGPATLIVASSLSEATALEGEPAACSQRLAERERHRRASFLSPLHASADAYLVRRDAGTTIIAGYPWFTDWGRDTFVSFRGLCLATGRLADAQSILLRWAREESGGMLPNFFPDGQRPPAFNTVDASLWFVIDVQELVTRLEHGGEAIDPPKEKLLWDVVDRILTGYAEGTRYAIQADPGDGLLRAGQPDVQLTWMDAMVGNRVVTPRIGKPVEVQALWINALAIGARRSARWNALFSLASSSFSRRFWNEEKRCLYDVVDVEHRRGAVDASLRPNQIFAVGGLPLALIDGERARHVVDCCERALYAANGLRSLAPGEAGYSPHYEGGPEARDAAYHQGTVWPWLLGAFVEAWVRVRGQSDRARREALERFVVPVEETMRRRGGLGHVSEIADAEEPHALRGCPFQAWSLGELLRLKLGVLAPSGESASGHEIVG